MSKATTAEEKKTVDKFANHTNEELDRVHFDANSKKNQAVQAANQAQDAYNRNPTSETEKAWNDATSDWKKHQAAFAEVDAEVKRRNVEAEKGRAARG